MTGVVLGRSNSNYVYTTTVPIKTGCDVMPPDRPINKSNNQDDN